MLKLVKKHIVILGISLSITMVANPVISEAKTAPENNTQESFINEIAPYAQKVQLKQHILPSIIISQAILESNWGKSKLAREGKNLFGIKGSYKGKKIRLSTREYQGGDLVEAKADFCVYPNWYESLNSHGELLREGPSWDRDFYKGLPNEKDYKKAATIIGKSGYSSDPNYAKKLILLIETFNLQKFDRNITTQKQKNKKLVKFSSIFSSKKVITLTEKKQQFTKAMTWALSVSHSNAF